MKIVIITNMVVHYILTYYNKLNQLTDNNTYYITTEPVPEERLKLGFSDYDDLNDNNIINAYKSDEDRDRANDVVNSADLILAGYTSEKINISNPNAIVFTMMEAYLVGDGKDWARKIKWGLKTIKKTKPNWYYLAISAYLPYDLRKSWPFFDINRVYKWAYFPEVTNEKDNTEKEVDINIGSSDRPFRFLWVGRFLKWKHLEYAISVVAYVNNELHKYAELTVAGRGDKAYTEELKKYAIDNNIEDKVNFVGSVQSDKISDYYNEADIYLFTSDGKEGWGAVLNEAMINGCAVIASDAPGSTRYLIEDKKNGLIYYDNDLQQLKEKARFLIQNPNLIKVYGENARHTIQSLWNADVASEQLIQLYKYLSNGKGQVPITGPCSKADYIERSAKAFPFLGL